VGGWRSSPPALRALARGGALRLLRCYCLEQRLQLLAHPPLLGGCRLRAAALQHGHGGNVLRRPPKSGRASASAFAPSLVRRLLLISGLCADVVGAPVAIPLAGLPLHKKRPALVVDRGARHPRRALDVEGPAPRRAGVSPPRVRRAAHATDRWRRGGAVLAPVRSCPTKRPRRRCTPAWGRGVAWFVPPESSQTQGQCRSRGGC
jgi:hypothetical protein